MDKRYYSPVELMKIAAQHAHSADNLLRNDNLMSATVLDPRDSLLSIISLMYIAFELTLKAYVLHHHGPIKQIKNLSELLELNGDLGFSQQELQLLKNLTRQHAFRKGIDYELWENRQQFHVFCSQIVSLYEVLQDLMPLELQADYQ